jgi:hypothetical protein
LPKDRGGGGFFQKEENKISLAKDTNKTIFIIVYYISEKENMKLDH